MKRFLLIFCILTLIPCCALDTKTQKEGAYDTAGGAATGIDGIWASNPPGENGRYYCDFKADGDTLRGSTYNVGRGYRSPRMPIKDGKIEGTNISFSFDISSTGPYGTTRVITSKCTGVLLGDELELSCTWDLGRSSISPTRSYVYKRIK